MPIITFVGRREDLEEAIALAAAHGVQSGLIEDLDDEGASYHSPVLSSIGEVATTVSMVFGAGTSAAIFIDKLRDLLEKRRSGDEPDAGVPEIEVNDAATYERLGSLSDSELEHLKRRLRDL